MQVHVRPYVIKSFHVLEVFRMQIKVKLIVFKSKSKSSLKCLEHES